MSSSSNYIQNIKTHNHSWSMPSSSNYFQYKKTYRRIWSMPNSYHFDSSVLNVSQFYKLSWKIPSISRGNVVVKNWISEKYHDQHKWYFSWNLQELKCRFLFLSQLQKIQTFQDSRSLLKIFRIVSTDYRSFLKLFFWTFWILSKHFPKYFWRFPKIF